MVERRSTYFAYQGLLVAVLLLLFLYQYRGTEAWIERLFFLVALSASSLGVLRLVSQETLSSWRFQTALFIGDAAVATLIISWTQTHPDFYLIYFLIIYGTALTRNVPQSLFIAGATSLLYLFSAWDPQRGIPHYTAFWLRFLFLWISSALLTILARDSQEAQADQERRYQGRLVEIGRLATLGQVAGEVAHRIKGPLTTIMVNAEILSFRKRRDKEVLKELKEIQEEVGHCKEILKSLLDLGRIEEVDRAPLDLREPARLALRSLEPQVRRLGLHVKTEGAESPLMVNGDQSLLQEAVAAVLQNAVEASRRGGSIRLRFEKAPARSRFPRLVASGGFHAITIEDDGKGISPSDLDHIFQPFFTTKGAQGSGLGLSAALRILQKHEGSIEAHSAGPGQGSRFRLTIPSFLPRRRR